MDVDICLSSILPSSNIFNTLTALFISIKSSKTSLLDSSSMQNLSLIILKAFINIILLTCCLPIPFFFPLYCLNIIKDLVAQCLNLLFNISLLSIAKLTIFLNSFDFIKLKAFNTCIFSFVAIKNPLSLMPISTSLC